jgi:hypothetical protein
VAERAKLFAYYCALHDKVFTSSRGANMHRKSELRKPGKGSHPTLEDMQKQDG